MDRTKFAIVVTPLAAIVTLAIGLRVGASGGSRAAIVSGAPLARGSHTLAWQVAVFAEDLGAREAVALSDLALIARHGVESATFHGATNSDGIAEVILTLPSLHEGDELSLEIRGAGELLGSGNVAWGPTWNATPHSAITTPTRRDGTIALDVAPLGGRLVAGFPTAVWIRATDRATGKALGGVSLEAEPEPGLEIPAPHATTCANGWAEIVATATYHVLGMSLHASKEGADGLWFGGLPVAAGASHVALPQRIAPDQPRTVDVTGPSMRGTIYAEIDDASGRAFAQILNLPRSTLSLPPLAEGLYWIVTANEPVGAESLEGGAVARPLLVTKDALRACETGALLSASAAPGFPRWTALDGFASRRDAREKRRGRGLFIGLVGLAVAAALETLLVVRAARRGRGDLAPALTRGSPAGGLAIGLLAVLLGFALLAAILLYRGT
jgi:hypothetical protein